MSWAPEALQGEAGMRGRRMGIGVVVGVGLLLALLVVAPPEVQARQEAPVNLQYFPADMSRGEVVQIMRQFSFALGVRCQYCHVGGDGRSFEGVVFESDEDPDKVKARFMLRMVETLNESMLPLMAQRDEPVSEITCKTCHRGLAKPALLTEVLRATMDAEGADAAVAEYHDLRETAGMAGRFDFGEWEVNTLADRLTAEERYEDAIAIYELNLEFYPESVSILFSLGGLYERIDDTEAALGYYERVLELMPGNTQAQGRIDALRG